MGDWVALVVSSKDRVAGVAWKSSEGCCCGTPQADEAVSFYPISPRGQCFRKMLTMPNLGRGDVVKCWLSLTRRSSAIHAYCMKRSLCKTQDWKRGRDLIKMFTKNPSSFPKLQLDQLRK